MCSSSTRERPSNNSHVQERSTLNLTLLLLQFIHVPVRPNILSLQEPGLWARNPNIERRWQAYIVENVVGDFRISLGSRLPSVSLYQTGRNAEYGQLWVFER
jgi:hypothetical protein